MIRTRRSALLGITIFLTCLTSAPATPAGAPQIAMKDFKFAPLTLTVKAGTAVTWVNKDNEPHTVVSDTGAFRSNAIDTNETFVVTFDKPGTYRFLCTIHPKMMGTIAVK